MLPHLQRQPTKSKEIRGRRKTRVNIKTSSHLGIQHTIDSPASSPRGADSDVNRFLSEEANDYGALGPERSVRHYIVVKVTGMRRFKKQCRSGETPSAG
jgi:hypothetical protein